MNWDELIVLVVRETGWTLDYIKAMPLDELYAFAEELSYQKSLDEWKTMVNFATVISTMVNLTCEEKIKPLDIVGQPPQRPSVKRKEIDIWKQVEKLGIRTPKDKS